MSDQTCNWDGIDFEIGGYYDDWNNVGGVYIFTKRSSTPNRWDAIRIGKAKSLKNRLTNHEDWPEAVRVHGATHVHARVVGAERERVEIETRLIRFAQPPMNKQHKK